MKNRNAFVACFLLSIVLMGTLSNFLPASQASVNITQSYVEGDHIRFFLKVWPTNLIPDLTINSSWAITIPIIDGSIGTNEWNDSFKSVIYGFNEPSPLYVKNDKDRLYVAVFIPSDHSADTDKLSIYFYPTSIYQTDFPHPAIDMYSNGTTKTNQLDGSLWSTKLTAEGRSWEFSVPIYSLSISDPLLRCNVEIYLSDGVNTPEEKQPHWPAFPNGVPIWWGSMGLARSSSENGEGITFLTLMSDLVPIVEKGYENLSNLLSYSPYSGSQISIEMNTNLYAIGVAGVAGNPIYIATVPTSPQVFFHELAHDFITLRSVGAIDEAEAQYIQIIFDTSITGPSQKDMLVKWYDPSQYKFPLVSLEEYFRSVLKNYEKNGARFGDLDLNLISNYDAEAIMEGILYYVVDTYGWKTLSRLSIYHDENTKTLDAWYPNANQTMHQINQWVYALSLGAGTDLTDLFRNRWHFPLINGNPFPCAISYDGVTYWTTIDTDRVVDIDTLKFDPLQKKISFQILGGSLGGHCNITIPKTLLKQNATSAWAIKINGTSTNYTFRENQTHTSISFNLSDTGPENIILTGAETIQPLITVTSSAHGSVSPGSQMVNWGTDVSLTISPQAGYHVADVKVNGTSVGAVTSYNFTVTGSTTIEASFAINTFNITVSAGVGGFISPTGIVSVNYGGSQNFNITANTGYHIADVAVDNASQGVVSHYSFTNVQVAHTITASFAINTYTVTVVQTTNGQITPGNATVNYGSNQVFFITPNIGYYISSLTVDGSPITVAPSYTFNNVTNAHTITATFGLTPGIPEFPSLAIFLASTALTMSVAVAPTLRKRKTAKN